MKNGIERAGITDCAGGSPGLMVPERVFRLATFAAWQAAIVIAFLFETHRLKSRLMLQGTAGSWPQSPALDGTYFLPLLLLAPFCWGFVPRSASTQAAMGTERDLAGMASQEAHGWRSSRCFQLFSVFVIGGVSIWSTWAAAQIRTGPDADSPRIQATLPLVQDELSYELQAETLLSGRWWWPGPDRAPELFHQMHVLNDGRVASRYFPGTGLWLTPWVLGKQAVWGQRAAMALVAIGVLLIGWEMHSALAGWIAGLLVALSPGMAIMGNLLLSHAPTCLGITLFLYAIRHCLEVHPDGIHPARAIRCWAWCAGMGLTFAMLCRPLTTAAIGFPFGVMLLGNAIRSRHVRHSQQIFIGMGAPLLCGFALMGWQNFAITGSVLETPYERYNTLYTPRHSFGFHNARSHLAEQSSAILHDYNQWAQNLDAPLAMRNLWRRLQGSFAWSLGVIPLTMTAVLCVFTLPWQSTYFRLLFAAMISLNVAHLPYWLDGILRYHYVFEAGLLWLLLFAVLSCQVVPWNVFRSAIRNGQCFRSGEWLKPAWWGCLVLLSIWVNSARLRTGWDTFLQSTASYRQFETVIATTSLKTPALILIQPVAADLHAQFVRQTPNFNGDVLVGMERNDLYSIEDLAALFPERVLYRYRTQSGQLSLIVDRLAEVAEESP